MADDTGPSGDLVAALREPSFWDARGPVELRETHISWVFLVDVRAYKLKKPLRLPFLDYSTVERRREMCEAEVALNRRLAPDLYLGVRGVVERDGRLALGAADDPGARDFLVEMRRFDEAQTLARRAAAGEPLPIGAVARALADFHASAAPAGDGQDPVAALARTLDATLANLGELLGAPGREDVARAATFNRAFLTGHGPELRERAARGLVRDCHGDLRAEHVVCEPRIEIVDCVEFDPALRAIDAGFDIAFLFMDLLARGEEEAAGALVSAYRDAGGDPGDDALVAFFAANRALLWSEILLLRGGERGPAEARRHIALAERLAWRARLPLVVALAGVAGSGKSVLAAALAERSGLPVLSSDVVRKRLAGLGPEDRGGSELYRDEATRATYAELGRLAGEAVGAHGGAIVDATFHRAASRRAFLDALGPALAPLWIECVAPAATLRRRVEDRARSGAGASDATADVLEAQLAAWEPIEGAQRLDTDRPPAAIMRDVEAALDARLASRPASAPRP